MTVIGKPFFVAQGSLAENASFVMYVLTTCLNFAVYLAILQLGVRTFVTELTASFQGIADKLLPASVPGVDCAVCYGFGDANAVTTQVILPETLEAPIAAGDELGTFVVQVNGETAAVCSLTAKEDVAKLTLGGVFEQFLKILLSGGR